MAVVVAAATAGAAALAACQPALPPRDPFRAADFTINKIADQQYAGFTVTGNVTGNGNLEIVSTSLNIVPVPGGRPLIVPGAVKIYSGSGTNWTATDVVTPADNLVFPNRPSIEDVDGDGRNDVLLPSGTFFTRADPTVGGGAITWWRNNGDGTFTRNDVITGVRGAYHAAIYTDFDGDRIKDIVTNFEDGGFPAYPFGPPVPFAKPITEVQYFKGLGAGAFAATPTKLADGGGSNPTVVDLDLDGDLDVASAQYFGVKTNPAGGPQGTVSNESFVWFERTGTASDGLDTSDFTKRVIARGLGESFELLPVDNIDGDGRYGAIGINHVNPATQNPALGASAEPQIVRLTPGADIRAEWNVTRIDSGITIDDARTGQAAPGFGSRGDVDGDGDIDLVFSGDADGTFYWLERKANGSWFQHDLIVEFGATPVDPKAYGQGSASVADLNRDGKNEIVISSFNSNSVEIISRNNGTGGLIPAVPRVPDAFIPYAY
jgi:hypothetical protein